MTVSERRLVSHLLGMAAEVYSNHGCNDFDLGEFMGVDERRALVEAYVASGQGDPDGLSSPPTAQETRDYFGDSGLMLLYSDRLAVTP